MNYELRNLLERSIAPVYCGTASATGTALLQFCTAYVCAVPAILNQRSNNTLQSSTKGSSWLGSRLAPSPTTLWFAEKERGEGG